MKHCIPKASHSTSMPNIFWTLPFLLHAIQLWVKNHPWKLVQGGAECFLLQKIICVLLSLKMAPIPLPSTHFLSLVLNAFGRLFIFSTTRSICQTKPIFSFYARFLRMRHSFSLSETLEVPQLGRPENPIILDILKLFFNSFILFWIFPIFFSHAVICHHDLWKWFFERTLAFTPICLPYSSTAITVHISWCFCRACRKIWRFPLFIFSSWWTWIFSPKGIFSCTLFSVPR